MYIDFLIKVFEENKRRDAIIWKDNIYTYGWLLDRIRHWQEIIKSKEIKFGTISIIEGDYSPNSIAIFLALVENRSILIPLTDDVGAKKPEFIKIAQGEVSFKIDKDDNVEIYKLHNAAKHLLYQRLKKMRRPGLLCFTSGSTGENKAVLHDLKRVLEKYNIRRRAFRTIPFLPFDHFGGVNTLLHTLSNGGCTITVEDRSSDAILKAVEKFDVELLPTSPTFINLILLSEAYKRHRLDSLKIISYGTEPMLETTLKRFHRLFPKIQLLQTYGLTEVGVLRSKSKSSDSLWVKVGGEGFKTRVVNGVLQIKAKSAMLGYLNAPSPFTKDGWLNTEDRVEVDGDYIRILGRQSEIINVGGQKVFPIEVENVIKEIRNIADVTVYGEKNPIVGNIVCAKIRLEKKEDRAALEARIKKYCAQKLERFKVPVKVSVVDDEEYGRRFKKIRI